MRNVIALPALVLLLMGPSLFPAEPVEELKEELREGLRKVSISNTKLASQYLEALEIIKREAISELEIERVKAIEKEIALFSYPGQRNYEAFPKLKKLRDFYEANAGSIEQNLQESRQTTLQIYRERFIELEKSLTAKGDTPGAVESKRHLQKIDAAIEDPEKVRTLTAFWTMEMLTDIKLEKEAIVERKGGAFRISSKSKWASYIESVASVKPPYEISMRAMTDSTNIRIYIGRRLLTIFNWEMRPTELRVHDPTPGSNVKLPVPDKGYLEVNQMYDIRIFVLNDRIHIVVDGEQRYMLEGDFTKLQGGVGVGPAFGSTVSVERFEILPLFVP